MDGLEWLKKTSGFEAEVSTSGTLIELVRVPFFMRCSLLLIVRRIKLTRNGSDVVGRPAQDDVVAVNSPAGE